MLLIFHAKVVLQFEFVIHWACWGQNNAIIYSAEAFTSLFIPSFLFSQNAFSSQASRKLSFIEGMSSKFAIFIQSG